MQNRKSLLIRISYVVLFILFIPILSLDAFSFSSDNLFGYKANITFEGKTLIPLYWYNEYNECTQSNRVSKDEYETNAEFEKRQKRILNKCDQLKTFNCVLKKAVKLGYDSESSLFTFWDKLGNACDNNQKSGEDFVFYDFNSWVKGSNYTIKYNNNYFDGLKNLDYNKRIEIKLLSQVNKARLLKIKENSLEMRYEGEFTQNREWKKTSSGGYYTLYKWTFAIKSIQLFDKETSSNILDINFTN